MCFLTAHKREGADPLFCLWVTLTHKRFFSLTICPNGDLVVHPPSPWETDIKSANNRTKVTYQINPKGS